MGWAGCQVRQGDARKAWSQPASGAKRRGGRAGGGRGGGWGGGARAAPQSCARRCRPLAHQISAGASGPDKAAASHAVHRVSAPLATPFSASLPPASPLDLRAHTHPDPGGKRRDELPGGRHWGALTGGVQGGRGEPRMGRAGVRFRDWQGCRKALGGTQGDVPQGWSSGVLCMVSCGDATGPLLHVLWDPPLSAPPLQPACALAASRQCPCQPAQMALRVVRNPRPHASFGCPPTSQLPP